jgi:hypothetical protein
MDFDPIASLICRLNVALSALPIVLFGFAYQSHRTRTQAYELHLGSARGEKVQ